MTFSKVNHKSVLTIIGYTVFGLLLIGLIFLHIFATKNTSGAFVFYFFFLLFGLIAFRPFAKIEITELFIQEKRLFYKKRLNWSDIKQVSLMQSTRSNAFFINEKQAVDSFLYAGVAIAILKERSPDPPDISWNRKKFIVFPFRPEAWEFIQKILSDHPKYKVLVNPIPKKR